MYEYGLKNLPGLIFLCAAYYNYRVIKHMGYIPEYTFSKIFKTKMKICKVLWIINFFYVSISLGLYVKLLKFDHKSKENRLIDPGSRAINSCIMRVKTGDESEVYWALTGLLIVSLLPQVFSW